MSYLTSITTKYKQNLAPAELRELLDQDEPLQLVDVREHAEFASGRIPGARLLPMGELQRRAAELDRSQPVVCVCRSGKRSAQAVKKLAALGFDGVHQLDGGLMAWEQAGFPLEKDERAPWALERQVRLAAGLLVLTGLGFSLVWPATIGLSWFVGTGLVFAAVTDWCGMGLLLARMPWNRSK
jgi:rhodanese-related sulfurtransferase